MNTAEPIGGLRKYAFIPFVIVSVLHLGFIALSNDALVGLSKPLLMPALLFGLLAAAPSVKNALVLIVGLGIVFSWFGDVLLQWPDSLGFILGLAAFLVAHVMYITAFVKTGSGRLPLWTSIYGLWYIVLLALLIPVLGSLTAPVIVYGAVLGAAAVLATRVSGVVAWGGALFLVSDSVLAMNKFLPSLEIPFVDFLIMATYLAGEGLIVFGLVAVLRSKRG